MCSCCRRDADSLDAKLGFCVLNTKDIFSWFQILHRDDEIEFSPDMAIIVPSSRKDGEFDPWRLL
jgi:hypothetical protein